MEMAGEDATHLSATSRNNDAHIRPEGWDNWGNPANEKTAWYGRAHFRPRVLKGSDAWNPLSSRRLAAVAACTIVNNGFRYTRSLPRLRQPQFPSVRTAAQAGLLHAAFRAPAVSLPGVLPPLLRPTRAAASEPGTTPAGPASPRLTPDCRSAPRTRPEPPF